MFIIEAQNTACDKFGARLKTLLAEKGYTQKDMAAKCGIAEASMSRYVNGVQFPRTPVLYTLAQALNVDMDYLAYGERSGSPSQYEQDAMSHKVFSFAMDARNFVRGNIPKAVCTHCGGPLEEYYCEDRLYLIRCLHCHTVAISEGHNPQEAALRTIGEPQDDPEGDREQ